MVWASRYFSAVFLNTSPGRRGAGRAALWAFDKKPGLYSMTDVLGLE
jgi:hypothetical protein